MAAPTVRNIAMFFKLNSGFFDHVQNNRAKELADGWTTLLNLGELCLGSLSSPPTRLDLGSKPGDNEMLLIFHNNLGSHAMMRVYSDGLVTLDIQHRDSTYDCSTASIRRLEASLVKNLSNMCLSHNSLHCPIRRGDASVWPYAVSADERLLEMDYSEIVHQETSQYQEIKIYRSPAHGHVLFLDGDAMLGESDFIYTQTLCRLGCESYTNKSVLVLGGGDGGILHEILKEQPTSVKMVEIDEAVLRVSRQYLRGICGDTLDSMTGHNYQIVIDDCVKVLKTDIDRGNKYDYVINDLTEFPVIKAVNGYGYDFDAGSALMKLSLQVLKSGGKLLARGNCLGATTYRERFESDVTALGCHFNRSDIYVPSFHEMYCVYEIWSSEDKSNRKSCDTTHIICSQWDKTVETSGHLNRSDEASKSSVKNTNRNTAVTPTREDPEGQ